MRGRVLLGVLGVAAAAYGAWSLLGEGLADTVSTAIWLAGGVVAARLRAGAAHPCACAGSAPGCCRPDGARAVAAGLVVLGTLTLLAVPVLGGWGANTDNATILGRDYATGWLVVATLTSAGVLAGLVTSRRRAGGQGARRR